MANYSGTPTVNAAWEIGDRSQKAIFVRQNLTITLSSQGGLTNLIPVTALGYQAGNVYGVQGLLFVDGSSVKRAVALMTDGTNVYTADPQVSTDGDRGKAADVTGTLTFEIWGQLS